LNINCILYFFQQEDVQFIIVNQMNKNDINMKIILNQNSLKSMFLSLIRIE